jgi:hypothetical protein
LTLTIGLLAGALSGGLKLVYDVALFAGFRNRRAEHERV